MPVPRASRSAARRRRAANITRLSPARRSRTLYSSESAHFSSSGLAMKSSHFFQFSSFSPHASKVSSVGGSKPHLLVAPLLATTGAAATGVGTGGFAEKALLSLNRPKRPAYVLTIAITICEGEGGRDFGGQAGQAQASGA